MHIRTFNHALLSFTLALLLCTSSVLAQQADVPTSVPEASKGPPTLFDNPSLVQRYQQSITARDLASHLYIFSSDFFEGRETATRGQKLAAQYLAAQYRKIGLAPKGTASADHSYAPEAYFQPFDVYGTRLTEARLDVTMGDEPVTSAVFSADAKDASFYPAFGNLPQSGGSVVFAGYGIADDELGYNDYAALADEGIDTAGKWLLMLRDEPLASDSTSLLSTPDGGPSSWTTSSYQKLRAGFNAGLPAGILVVGDVGPNGVDVAKEAARHADDESVGSLSLEEQGSQRQFPPMYVISSELANQILAPADETVDALKQRIDADLEPIVFDVHDVTINSQLTQETFKAQTENVVAYLEGSDPALKDEVVILSSHYDHIGIEPTGEDRINNGADDDGSGTVAILEIAEAFMAAAEEGYRPRRSILFLNVSGEEKGLLGSGYYADTEPIFPLEKTVTNLNIDMIGRHDPTHPTDNTDYVYIIGSKLISEELHTINLRANEITGIDLELNERFNSKDDPNRFYARSDHWNFGKHGIPFIFFFTGTHEDYHQPGDEAHKIDYDRLARISRLIFATAWQVANQDEPPAVSGTGFN